MIVNKEKSSLITNLFCKELRKSNINGKHLDKYNRLFFWFFKMHMMIESKNYDIL